MAATTKEELLNEAAREYKGFHEALQGLNESQLTEVWLGTWSVKEIVAHIATPAHTGGVARQMKPST